MKAIYESEGDVNLYKNDEESLQNTLEKVKYPTEKGFGLEKPFPEPLSGNDENCLTEVYDRIYEFFFVGKSYYEYRYKKSHKL